MKRANRSLFTALLIATGLATGCAKLPALKPVDYPVATQTAAPTTPLTTEKYRLGEAVDLATLTCDVTETSAVPACRAKRFHKMSWMAPHGQTVGRAWVRDVLNGHGDSFVIAAVCDKGALKIVSDNMGFRASCQMGKQPATPLFQIGPDDAVYEQLHQGPNGAIYYQFGTR